MARIRTLKPSFWGDDRIARLSRDERLLAIGLISMADDEGRFLASPAAVAGFVFPNDDLPTSRVRKWLEALNTVGVIGLYEVSGVRYGHFPRYRKHQVINRMTPSNLPEPPQETLL